MIPYIPQSVSLEESSSQREDDSARRHRKFSLNSKLWLVLPVTGGPSFQWDSKEAFFLTGMARAAPSWEQGAMY